MHNTESIIKKILKDKPFSNLINIIQIEKLIGNSPHTVFKIQDSRGKFYKLRKCESIKFARRIERDIQLVLQFFPKFYGRDKKYLLFDFVQGRALIKNESLNIIYKIGKMNGEVNKYKFSNNYDIDTAKNKYDERLRKKFRSIFKKKIITTADYQRILRIYTKLKQKIEYDIVLDVRDINPSNFIIDSENKLYCIDEGSIRYSIKGYGFIKPFLHWFNKEQKKSFFDGYDSVDPIGFFHKDYKKFVTLLYCIGKIFLRFKTGRDYSVELKKLLEFE